MSFYLFFSLRDTCSFPPVFLGLFPLLLPYIHSKSTQSKHILLLAGVFGFYWLNTIWWGWICSPPLHHPSIGMQFGNGLCVCICVCVWVSLPQLCTEHNPCPSKHCVCVAIDSIAPVSSGTIALSSMSRSIYKGCLCALLTTELFDS